MNRASSLVRLFVRSRAGSTAVEFAMILPVFLAVIFGIIEFGRMIWTRNTMEHAVEVAARWGAINTAKTDAEIEAYAATQLIVITSPPVAFASTSSSSSVSLTATNDFNSLAAAFGIPSLTLTATAQFPR